MTTTHDVVKWVHKPDGSCSWAELWWRYGVRDQTFIATTDISPGVFFILKGLGSESAITGPIQDLDAAKVAYLLLEDGFPGRVGAAGL